MRPKLFLGSSREAVDEGAATLLEQILQNELPNLEIVLWTKSTWINLDTALNSLTQSLADYSYAVFLAWPDDILQHREKSYYCCRDNVIFELGLFLAHLGTKKTFLVTPQGNTKLPPLNYEFRIPSDLDVPFRTQYNLELDTLKNRIPRFHIEVLKKSIEGIEAERPDSPVKAREMLDNYLLGTESQLNAKGRPSSYYANCLSSAIGRMVELKAMQTSMSTRDAAKDLLLFLGYEENVCNVSELAEEQLCSDSRKIEKIWVFADSPLEFQEDGQSFEKLKETIKINLLKGVKYTYFISSKSYQQIRINSIIPAGCTEKEKLIIRKRVSFIVIDPRFFSTYFTLHFLKDKSRPVVYMSALRENRKFDFLMKVVDNEHVDRILENLEQLRGKVKKHDGATMTHFHSHV